MAIKFITGNPNKFRESQAIIPELEQLNVDLDEIQELDAKKIMEHKLKEAFRHCDGKFIIEDQGFYIECLNGLPGPLIRWFWQPLGVEKIARIVEFLGNNRAEAKTIIAYAKNAKEVHFFEYALSGKVVRPRGKGGFGWDVIFQPDGYKETFGEMKEKHPGQPSPLRLGAYNQLKKFLAERDDV